MTKQETTSARIVILASGGGSNAQMIMEYCQHSNVMNVVAVLTDRKAAGVRQRAEAFSVPSVFVGKSRRQRPGGLLEVIQRFNPNIVVLAGYLRLIPADVLSCFPERVINIHPALLPKYGGPGMYGHHVHEAVAKTGDASSGITIHLANERYDEGKVLFQASTSLQPGITPQEVAERVLALEHKHYPRVLEAYVKQLLNS